MIDHYHILMTGDLGCTYYSSIKDHPYRASSIGQNIDACIVHINTPDIRMRLTTKS